MSEEQIKHMVNRFLMWRLPKPWHPDNGISYQRPNYAHEPADHDWPTGTNLFDATQTDAMVRHMVEGISDWDQEAFAWLIEAPGARYLGTREIGHDPRFFWTTEHSKALRFVSKDAADGAMMAIRALAPELWAFAANLGEARPT
jgi:hypothetical protein